MPSTIDKLSTEITRIEDTVRAIDAQRFEPGVSRQQNIDLTGKMIEVDLTLPQLLLERRILTPTPPHPQYHFVPWHWKP